jgi:hypothetical protein
VDNNNEEEAYEVSPTSRKKATWGFLLHFFSPHEETILEDNNNEEEAYEGSPTSRKKASWGILLLGAFLVLMVKDGSSSSSSLESSSSKSTCFIDSVMVYDEKGKILSSCHRQDGAPCPTHGVCENGVLVQRYIEKFIEGIKLVLVSVGLLITMCVQQMMNEPQRLQLT